MASVTQLFKPGEDVPWSGIYEVVHDSVHKDVHEITVIAGHKFPPCNHCGNHPRFKLVKAAYHISNHDHFKKK